MIDVASLGESLGIKAADRSQCGLNDHHVHRDGDGNGEMKPTLEEGKGKGKGNEATSFIVASLH